MLIMMLLLAAGAAVAISEVTDIVEEIEDMTDVESLDYSALQDQTDQLIDAGRDEPPSEEDIARLEALTSLTSNTESLPLNAPAAAEPDSAEPDAPASPLDVALSGAQQTTPVNDLEASTQHQATDSGAHPQPQDPVAASAHLAMNKGQSGTSMLDRL